MPATSLNGKVRAYAISVHRLLFGAATLLLASALASCSGAPAGVEAPRRASPPIRATRAPPPPEKTAPALAHPALASWLGARLPKGGTLIERGDRSIGVVHLVEGRDTIADLADAYLELTRVYAPADLVRAIRQANALTEKDVVTPGTRLEIPEIIGEVPGNPGKRRLGWPDDKTLRGLHLRPQVVAGRGFARVIDQMVPRGMNLVVIDVKDANGRLSYPSRVPLANEIGAVKNPPIKHLWRTIQFAHDRGIRVAMRIVCFADDTLSLARDDLAVQSIRRRPLHIGWLDPSNDIVQKYVMDLATEAMDAGADEIQIDYARYPVTGVDNADFRLKERGLRRPRVITDFVHRVHELTQASGVSLSVDVFGIVAEGVKTDLENLGQDPALLARECEALAPMFYPSHYPKGFMGFEEPGDHPELVQVGVRKLLALIRRGGGKEVALVRPWIQGMPYHAPSFGPQYIAQEMNHAAKAGATGWMVWNPTQDFTDTWQAVARKREAP